MNDLEQRDNAGKRKARQVGGCVQVRDRTGGLETARHRDQRHKYGEQTPVALLDPVSCGTTVGRRRYWLQVKERTSASATRSSSSEGRSFLRRRSLPEHDQDRETLQFPRPAGVHSDKLNDTAVLFFCTNEDSCPAQFQKRLESFAKRERMDIAGLGRETASVLVDSGLVKTVADLYKLKKEQLLKLERMGDLSAQNLLDGIAASKTRGLGKLLSGLSIPNVGERYGPELARRSSMDKLLATSKQGWRRSRASAEARGASGTTSTLRGENWSRAARGRRQADGGRRSDASRGRDALTNKTVVVTGTLKKYKR
jgi:DNA ligase (NAD+)